MSQTLNKKLVMQWLNQEIEAIKAFEKESEGQIHILFHHEITEGMSEEDENEDRNRRVRLMNESYIAGFFDGEGSAMIITIKRKAEHGIVYQFRPTIKIAQKTQAVLFEIKNYLHFGRICSHKNGCSSLLIGGYKEINQFIERISPFTFIKTEALKKLHELIVLQKTRNSRQVHSKETIEKMIDIRDDIKKLNGLTRTNISTKYSKEKILSTMSFPDVEIWKKKRVKRMHESQIIPRKPRITISCACGCGNLLITPNKYGRDKKYIKGHNALGKHWTVNKGKTNISSIKE